MDYQNFCGTTPDSCALQPDEVPVQELKRALDNPGLGIQVLDVREPDEHQIAQIRGARLFPLTRLPEQWIELDPEQSYYLHCKAGGRSLKALQFLRERGFKRLKSVKGGITAWSNEIDPAVPKY